MWGSRSSKDLMLSIGSEPGKVVALPKLRLGWRREERSYLGYGGRGGKDHYVRGGGGCSVVASFLGQATKEDDHHSLSVSGTLCGEEPPPSIKVFSFES